MEANSHYGENQVTESATPIRLPPTSICALYFDQAQVEFDKGFNAAGFEQVLQGIECLYIRGLLSEIDLQRAIKQFHTIIRENKKVRIVTKQKGLLGE